MLSRSQAQATLCFSAPSLRLKQTLCFLAPSLRLKQRSAFWLRVSGSLASSALLFGSESQAQARLCFSESAHAMAVRRLVFAVRRSLNWWAEEEEEDSEE
jgi:hypothetical protein